MTKSFSRELLRGSIDFMVLGVLADRPKYGYLIQQDIGEASAQRVKLPPGTLYPLLHRMEADKLIKSKWDSETGRKRKWYEITAKGKKQLEAQVIQWQEYVDCVSQVISMLPGRQSKTNLKPKPA